MGKTSLANMFMNCHPPEDHDPTIEDRYRTTLIVKERTTEVEIIDTAGESAYQYKIDTWINEAEGFILVFAINDVASYEHCQKTHDHILKNKNGKRAPIMLLGNKSDLQKDQRKIEYFAAKGLAESWGAEYVETSAKGDYNVKEVFVKISDMVLNAQSINALMPRKKKCCSSCLIV